MPKRNNIKPAKTGKCETERTQSVGDESAKDTNKGALIMDATCAPEDMRLLHKALFSKP